MAEEEKTDEVAEETTEETTEQSTEESKETETDAAELKAHEDFDKKIDDDEAEEVAEQAEETTEEKPKEEKEEETAVEETPVEEKTKTETEEEDSGTVEKTAQTQDVDDSLVEGAVRVGLSLSLAKKASSAELETYIANNKVEEKAEEVKELEPFDCGLDPNEYSKEVIDLHNKLGQQSQDTKVAMEKMAADHKKDIDGVSAKSTAASAEQARRQVDNMMDGFFNGMDGLEKVLARAV